MTTQNPERPAPESQALLHRWLWRWHGYAGLFVIPFIFFMSLTGLPHVWAHELEEWLHPEYRALTPQPQRVSYEAQMATARAACPDKSLAVTRVDGDPRHATQFRFGEATNPTSVFVNPYDGKIITQFNEWTRLSFAAISLHGLVFMEPYGSWLLELLACWGIVLCFTGVYLWWPRGRESRVWGVLLPRLRADGRTRWRDMHAVTGFWFAAVLAFYLITGLPWTAFWGGQLLTRIQNATGQGFPQHMTNCCDTKSAALTPGAKPAPLDDIVAFGLAQKLPGVIEIEPPAEADGTWHVRNRFGDSARERHYQLDAFTAKVVAGGGWENVPLSQRAVLTGINLHEGQLLGRTTQILSTALACSFMLMAGAAAAMWWRRRPQGRLDLPKAIPQPPLPRALRWALTLTGLALPLLGLSFLIVAGRRSFQSRP